ncbi:MAG: hypothetical protein ACD_32C00092G0001 [uncultured bacterium]|nr:MAG: hypothetical protein ACD_32C00092G0001 [uncultured bacterium]
MKFEVSWEIPASVFPIPSRNGIIQKLQRPNIVKYILSIFTNPFVLSLSMSKTSQIVSNSISTRAIRKSMLKIKRCPVTARKKFFIEFFSINLKKVTNAKGKSP